MMREGQGGVKMPREAAISSPGNLQPPGCGEFATFVAGEFARFASMRSG